MKVVNATGFQGEFNESPTLATFADERVSQILGRVERLTIENGDDVTVFDFDTIVVRGGTLRAFGSGTVYVMSGLLYAHDEVRVIAFGEAKVVSYGRVPVIAHDKVTVVGYERSRITLRSFSSAELHDFAMGSFYNFTRASLHDNSSGYGYDMSEIDLDGDHTSLRGRGNARVQVNGTPAVRLAGNAVVHTAPATRTQFIEASENSRIVSGPMTRAADVPLVPSTTPTTGYQSGGSPAADRASVVPEVHPAPAPVTDAPLSQTSQSVDIVQGSASEPAGDAAPSTSRASSGTPVPLPEFGQEWRPLRSSSD